MNLLAALDVLLEEGSVGGAAGRLHLSQPAMSRALSRIRKATGDEVLVRSGRTMVPTPYAVAVRDEVHQLAEQVRAVLSPARELRLAELDVTFTLQCHDAITAALSPRLLRRVRSEAPGVRLRFLAEASIDDSGLRTGRTDLEIGSGATTTADIESHIISSGRLIVAMRADHRLTRAALTAKRYAGVEHVTVSRRGRFSDPIDDALAELGLTRTVVATAPTSTAALRIVQGGDCVAAVPEGICQPDIDAFGLVATPLPLDIPGVPMVMSWHIRNGGDTAHRWLRRIVRDELGISSGIIR
ncbi:LysR family transcriptional regulator [Gryllotalpicola reticulitermitis]|uniref:LysR family transcriptional regulator n=1 Tax=Gryllotalpicola reticulitermitis TaxID=1184153 RepID=A0ABV8Q3E8_9MICO